MKGLDEYFLMVLFVLLLKGATKGMTKLMKALDEYFLMVLFV